MRQAGARLECGRGMEAAQDTLRSVELFPKMGILREKAWTRRCCHPLGPHSPEVLAQEDGQESIPAFTHPAVCLSATHRCCHSHDCCYKRAEVAGCSPKMERYSWQCVNQHILCGEFPASDPVATTGWSIEGLPSIGRAHLSPSAPVSTVPYCLPDIEAKCQLLWLISPVLLILLWKRNISIRPRKTEGRSKG